MSENTENVEWIDFATKVLPVAQIPVGIRFQANVPNYTGFSHASNDLSTEKWLGVQTWPIQHQDQATSSKRVKTLKRVLEDEIGKGYRVICFCSTPGSIKCVKRHLTEERMKIQDDLKIAYQSWKFDQVGDVVSVSWSQEHCKTFQKMVKENADEGFMKHALESLPSKTRGEIVEYYLNVYIPSRISKESRYGREDIDTDESDSEKDGGSGSSSRAKKYLSGGGPSFNDASNDA